MDVLHVFDSLNYTENLNIGVDVAGNAGGYVEGTISYTGDLLGPNKDK